MGEAAPAPLPPLESEILQISYFEFVLEFLSAEKSDIFILYMVSYIILCSFIEKKVYKDNMSLRPTIGKSVNKGQAQKFGVSRFF